VPNFGVRHGIRCTILVNLAGWRSLYLIRYTFNTWVCPPVWFFVLKLWCFWSLIVSNLRGPQGQYIWECKYGWVPSARIRVNSYLRPYKTSPSPAIRDITVSGHTRHHHSGHTRHLCYGHTRLISSWDLYLQHSPILLRFVEQEKQTTNKQTNKQMMPIVASLKPCVAGEQGKSTTIVWGWPFIYTKKSVFLRPPIDLQLP